MNRPKTFFILMVAALFLAAIFAVNAQGQAPEAGQKGPPAGTSDTPGEKLTAIILPAAEILKATQRVAGSDGKEGK